MLSVSQKREEGAAKNKGGLFALYQPRREPLTNCGRPLGLFSHFLRQLLPVPPSLEPAFLYRLSPLLKVGRFCRMAELQIVWVNLFARRKDA